MCSNLIIFGSRRILLLACLFAYCLAKNRLPTGVGLASDFIVPQPHVEDWAQILLCVYPRLLPLPFAYLRASLAPILLGEETTASQSWARLRCHFILLVLTYDDYCVLDKLGTNLKKIDFNIQYFFTLLEFDEEET